MEIKNLGGNKFQITINPDDESWNYEVNGLSFYPNIDHVEFFPPENGYVIIDGESVSGNVLVSKPFGTYEIIFVETED